MGKRGCFSPGKRKQPSGNPETCPGLQFSPGPPGSPRNLPPYHLPGLMIINRVANHINVSPPISPGYLLEHSNSTYQIPSPNCITPVFSNGLVRELRHTRRSLGSYFPRPDPARHTYFLLVGTHEQTSYRLPHDTFAQ